MADPHDQKEFLELLHRYKSEETKKARRNISLIAFVVISANALGIRIADIKVFGSDLSRSSDFTILLIAAVLLLYWLVMFCVSYAHDSEIQKERSIRLEGQIKRLMDRWDRVENQRIASSGQNYPSDYHEVKSYVDALTSQQSRTEKAASLGRIVNSLELYIPLILSVVGFVVLGIGIARALE